MLHGCCLRERDISRIREVTDFTKRVRQGPLLYLALSQLFTLRLDSLRSGCVSSHLFGCFRWLALTSRVLLDLGPFWDCDFVSCGLCLEPLYDFALHASLQIPDKTPGEEGTLDGLRGIPLASSQNWRKKIFLYCVSGAGRFGSFFSRCLPFYFLTYLKLG